MRFHHRSPFQGFEWQAALATPHARAYAPRNHFHQTMSNVRRFAKEDAEIAKATVYVSTVALVGLLVDARRHRFRSGGPALAGCLITTTRLTRIALSDRPASRVAGAGFLPAPAVGRSRSAQQRAATASGGRGRWRLGGCGPPPGVAAGSGCRPRRRAVRRRSGPGSARSSSW